MTDIKEALRLYDAGNYLGSFEMATELAKGGEVDAYILLGWIYERGKIDPSNEDLALKYYQAAANSGSGKGRYALGKYLKARGHYEDAFKYFCMASEDSNLPGTYNAGLCYEFGTGTNLDQERAFQYYESAARGGHIFARMKIARKYLKCGNPLKIIRGMLYFILTPLHMIVMVLRNKYDERTFE